MASALMGAVRTVSGNSPSVARPIEKLTQTFKAGVPVQLDGGTGAIQEWDGVTVTDAIAGIAKDNGSNLTTTGTGQSLSFGSVQNESSALNLARGGPIAGQDGKITVEVAAADTVFSGQVGPSQTTAVTDVGTNVGMTKDTDGHWFADKTKLGASAVVTIVGLDSRDATRGVFFVIMDRAAQIVA